MNIFQVIKTSVGALIFRAYARITYGLQFRVARPEEMAGCLLMSEKVRSAFYDIVPFEMLDEHAPSKDQLEARTQRQGYWVRAKFIR